MRISKSGKITINLGPNEVKDILENPDRHISRWGSKVQNKIRKAVAEKFSNVQADMAEELQARNLWRSMRSSDAWKSMSAGFEVEHKAINKMCQELNLKEANAMEQLVQQAFDEAGIVHFKPTGYGYKKVVTDDSN